jgi:2-C-methyl-D-erythritol 4-phosphate cytidylyltransferase
MGGDRPKQYLPLAGRTVLEHSIAPFLNETRIDGIVLVLRRDDPWWPDGPVDKPLLRATGGVERCHSVVNGLRVLRDRLAPQDWVLVHDAARPCLPPTDLDSLLTTMAEDPVGGLLAIPVRDTLKREDGGGRVSGTVARTGLWQAQTPQMFRFGLLSDALESVLTRGLTVTDEAGAVETTGARPRLVVGHVSNLKITHPEDIELAAVLLGQLRVLAGAIASGRST